jgi:hypothetical protein
MTERSAETIPLAGFLSLDDKEKALEIWSNADHGKDHLLARITVPWGPLKERLILRLAEQLNMPLMELFISAWKKVDEIQSVATKSHDRPREKNPVDLVSHELTYDCEPTLEVTLGPHRFDPVKFALHVCLKLDGCVLIIMDGRIVAIRPGTCEGEATLSYEGFEFAKAKTEKTELGPEYQLQDAIEIDSTQ